MPVSLSIKNAPDDVVERLRARAARNHRSLQGELLAVIEAAVRPEPPPVDVFAVLERARARKLPQGESSVSIIRAMRDGR